MGLGVMITLATMPQQMLYVVCSDRCEYIFSHTSDSNIDVVIFSV